MHEIRSVEQVRVEQNKEWGEIITGVETRNSYSVTSGNSRIYLALEKKGSAQTAFMRMILRSLRSFEIDIYNSDRKELIARVTRPFRWYFHEIYINTPDGENIGCVKRKFSLLSRKYCIALSNESDMYYVEGSLFNPWVFDIKGSDGGAQGKMVKEWGGILKEVFSSADNFTIDFPKDWSYKLKILAIGCVLLIDFVHFESSNLGNR